MGDILVRGFQQIVFSAFLMCLFGSVSNATKKDDSCLDIMELTQAEKDSFNLVEQYNVDLERPSLLELLSPDPKKNLAARYPSMLVGAYQNGSSWINALPKQRIVDPHFGGGYIDSYPALSTANPLNGNRFINWQFEAVNELGKFIDAVASGDGSRKVPVFVGPSGTGKTEFLDVLLELGRNITTRDPNKYMWTFEFVNLEEIPELLPILNGSRDSKTNQIKYVRSVQPMVYESPMVLLPEPFQKKVVEIGSERAREVIGYTPKRSYTPSPATADIMRAILAHYSKAEGLEKLSPEVVVRLLSKHVQLKRFIPSVNGKRAKIEYQGKDLDYGALFVGKNPLQYVVLGSDNPHSYTYTGKILQGQGTAVFLDELPRQDEAFQNVMLAIQESRLVSLGGSPAVPLDAIIIAAGNTESLKNIQETAGNYSASVDRMTPIKMVYETHPIGIQQLLLMMRNSETLSQFPLEAALKERGQDPSTARMEPLNFSDLFKLPTSIGGRAIGPEGRYAIYVNSSGSGEPVQIAPHALEAISFVLSATRIETDVTKAMSLRTPFGVITDNVFRNPIFRIKGALGEIPVSESQSLELGRLANLLNEGTSGISQRDASDWFRIAINKARQPSNHNTLTPFLVFSTLRDLLDKDSLNAKKNQTRLLWGTLAEMVKQELIIPRVIKDILSVLGDSTAGVERVHDEIMKEAKALQANAGARDYEDEKGRHIIDMKRLNEIRAIYKREHGREFALEELVNFSNFYRREGGQRSTFLEEAVRLYLAHQSMQTISATDLLAVGRNPDSVSGNKVDFVSEILDMMQRRYGYNREAAVAAFQMFYDDQNQRAQLE